jgi:hypothetical protein
VFLINFFFYVFSKQAEKQKKEQLTDALHGVKFRETVVFSDPDPQVFLICFQFVWFCFALFCYPVCCVFCCCYFWLAAFVLAWLSAVVFVFWTANFVRLWGEWALK